MTGNTLDYRERCFREVTSGVGLKVPLLSGDSEKRATEGAIIPSERNSLVYFGQEDLRMVLKLREFLDLLPNTNCIPNRELSPTHQGTAFP